MVSSSPRSKPFGRQISSASNFAGVSPVAHSSSESSCCVFSLFAISRSLLRFTPWSSPCRSLTSRARASSRAASSARRSLTDAVIESVIGSRPGDGDELAQYVKVHVVEFLHVDAAGALRVLTQLGEQGGAFWQVLEPVDRQLRLARGEPDLRPVADPARVRR